MHPTQVQVEINSTMIPNEYTCSIIADDKLCLEKRTPLAGKYIDTLFKPHNIVVSMFDNNLEGREIGSVTITMDSKTINIIQNGILQVACKLNGKPKEMPSLMRINTSDVPSIHIYVPFSTDDLMRIDIC